MDIYISPESEMTEFECGSKVMHSPLLINEEGRFTFLDDAQMGEIKEVKFLIKRWYGWHQLYLPEELEQVTARFLSLYHNDKDESFDCYSFVTIASGLPIHDKCWLNAFWDTEVLVPKKGLGYHIIFMVDEDSQRFGHAAIHIGQGYFLSVQGAGGRLSVSRLEDLQVQYRDRPHLWIAKPKPEMEIEEALAIVAGVQSKERKLP